MRERERETERERERMTETERERVYMCYRFPNIKMTLAFLY